MSKTAKFSIFTAIVILIAILAYLYASPYLALKNMKTAAQQNDLETINQYIDYPSVRQSLKEQLNAYMLKELRQESDNEFAKFGTMLASSMTDSLLDAVITPSGVGLMLQGKNLNPSHMPLQTTTTSHIDAVEKDREKVEYKMYYSSFNRFVINIKNTERHDQRVQVIMQRDGLNWQIKQLIIPIDHY